MEHLSETTCSCSHTNSRAEFSENIHSRRSFPKAQNYKSVCMWTKGRITSKKVCKDSHTQVDKRSSCSHLFPSTGVSLELDPPLPELSSCAAGPEKRQTLMTEPLLTQFVMLPLFLTLPAHCLHCFSSRQSPAALARSASSGLSFRSNHLRL